MTIWEALEGVPMNVENVGHWVKVPWASAESGPALGENRGGLEDNGMNLLCLCVKDCDMILFSSFIRKRAE
jgi:hypothetical protein